MEAARPNRLIPVRLPADPAQRWFMVFILVLLASGSAALLLDTPLALLPVAGVVGLGVVMVDWRWLYYLLLSTLAFSKQIQLPGGLSMDVPSEPLMLVVLTCLLLSLLLGRTRLTRREVLHPLTVLVLLTLLWAGVSLLFSVDTVKSIKFLLAKFWYVGPFLFVTLLLVRRPADVWRVVGCHAFGACMTVLWEAPRHASRGFTFADINWAVQPFYINHVSFATVLALLLPYAFYGRQSRLLRGRWRLIWTVALGLMVFGLVTSYTRASILSLPVAAMFYVVLRYRLTAWVLVATFLGVSGGVSYFVQQNNFMLYAPDFEKTIFNGDNFEKHLEATYKLQDVSGMERVYRWVAAARMVNDKPLTGSGPSTFYPEYKRYTVTSFRTYVSDNPEHSTTHNYFLLLLAEQGIPGCAIFLALICTALLTGQHLYHRSKAYPALRQIVLATTLSLVVILFHLTLNELIEVDKIGSFFFVALAVLIKCGGWLAEAQRKAASQPQPGAATAGGN